MYDVVNYNFASKLRELLLYLVMFEGSVIISEKLFFIGMIKKIYARILSTPKLPDCSYQPEPYSGPSFEEVMQNRN